MLSYADISFVYLAVVSGLLIRRRSYRSSVHQCVADGVHKSISIMYPGFSFRYIFTLGSASYRYGSRRVTSRGCAFRNCLRKEQGLAQWSKIILFHMSGSS